MLETGGFPVNAAVSAIVPLEDAPRALKEWSEHPSRFSKIMVQIS